MCNFASGNKGHKKGSVRVNKSCFVISFSFQYLHIPGNHIDLRAVLFRQVGHELKVSSLISVGKIGCNKK